MSEPEAVYITGKDEDLQEIVCQHCGMVLGREVTINGKFYLRINGTDLYSFHGWHNCRDGERVQVHWDSGEVKLRRLLKRMRERV